MDTEPFTFPVWLYVNSQNHPEDGYPFYLMIRGGHDTPIPASLAVFSTRDNAANIGTGPPFVIVEMDRATFYEALNECRYVEDLVFDMGTPNAVIYRVEEILNKFGPDTKSE